MKAFIGLMTFLATLVSFTRVILVLGGIAWLILDPYGLGHTIGSFIAAIVTPIKGLF